MLLSQVYLSAVSSRSFFVHVRWDGLFTNLSYLLRELNRQMRNRNQFLIRPASEDGTKTVAPTGKFPGITGQRDSQIIFSL